MDATGDTGAAIGNLAVIIPIAAAVAAVVLGVIIGIVVGKYQVRRARSGGLKVLTKKEKIIYGSCVLAGIVCIALGAFVKLPAAGEPAPENGITVGDEAVPDAEAEADADADANTGRVAIDTGEVVMAEARPA